MNWRDMVSLAGEVCASGRAGRGMDAGEWEPAGYQPPVRPARCEKFAIPARRRMTGTLKLF